MSSSLRKYCFDSAKFSGTGFGSLPIGCSVNCVMNLMSPNISLNISVLKSTGNSVFPIGGEGSVENEVKFGEFELYCSDSGELPSATIKYISTVPYLIYSFFFSELHQHIPY